MQNREDFLKSIFLMTLALITPPVLINKLFSQENKAKSTGKRNPKTAAVLWFSQAGHTERIGRLIAKRWEKSGLKVTSGDMRSFDKKTLPQFDIIAIGCPVYYYEAPENVQDWIESLPKLDSIPVVSFSTFGGEGHNQYNTACQLLELMSAKGAIPCGYAAFGNMSTFAPTWSTGNSERILKYKNLPNEETYKSVREFAAKTLDDIKSGKSTPIDSGFTFYDVLSYTFPAWLTKKMIAGHKIDKLNCIECGTCVKKCPVNAITADSLKTGKVDTDKCIACMGCVNNCPVQAVKMKMVGTDIYGFNKFCEDNKIVIKEPEELL